MNESTTTTQQGLPRGALPRRRAIGAVAALAVALTVLLGGVLRESPGEASSTARVHAAAGERLRAGFAAGDTPRLIADLERRVQASPDDASSLALLGLALQQRYRETVDAGLLPRSEDVLRRARRLAPDNVTPVAGLASLALTRHEFRRALELGRRAQALAPGSAQPYGIVGDALLELGRYDEAFEAFDAMARIKPNVASYARVAYGRELIGRPRAAIAAMELAREAANRQPEPTAWTSVELGKLHFGLGELEQARRELKAALAVLPGYVYALDGLARVEHALGNRRRAAELAARAVDSVPLPQFAATLGDLHAASGDGGRAREQYELVGAIDTLLRTNGVRTDLELALFDVDHGIRLEQALEKARAAHAERPSLVADDTLSFALARNGRCEEAVGFSKRALRLGTRDALMFFHRGYAERCAGRPVQARRWFARALELNPNFSLLWSPVARRALA